MTAPAKPAYLRMRCTECRKMFKKAAAARWECPFCGSKAVGSMGKGEPTQLMLREHETAEDMR